jgi:PAS domain S-box-containing protein
MADTPTPRRAAEPKAAVLLVDDQPANLTALRAVLGDLGPELVEARSGEEAMERLREGEFTVILLDVNMPGIDGYETAQQIRAREESRHTPIIFVTAFDADLPAVERAYALGAVDFLFKPLSAVIVRAKVAGFVDLFEKARLIRQLERREFERRLAEEDERLRVQREWLRTTLHSIGDAVIATDTQGNVTFLNPVAESLTGWPAAEAAGRLLEEVFVIVNEQTRRSVENPVTKVLREGCIVGMANHTILIARDGREIPIDDSAAPIRGEGGVIAGVVMVFRDVTEARRAAEARLRLAAIVDSADDAIIGKNLDGIVTSWNPAAERLYGFTADEIVGQPLARLVPQDQPDELPALLEKLKRGERVEHFETVRVRKDGTRVAVSLTISPIRDAEGQVVGASKIARDITAAKRREAALQFLAGAGAVLAELTDVPDTLQKVAALAVPHFADWCAVDLLGPDGALDHVAVAHADPEKVELARDLRRRYPPNPANPGGAWNVIRTGKSELISEITDAALAAGARDADHLRALRELGLRSYMGVPLAVRGKVLGTLSFVAAESGRRYDADDLRLAEDLARRAATAIENARLYADLRAADARKDEFLALLGHELRNPLAPIKNAVRLLELKGDDPVVAGRARVMIDRQATQLTHLVDELLDASRVARGKVRLWVEPLDLAALVRTAVEDHRHEAESAGLAVELAAPPGPVPVRGDAARLTQVVTNLWGNATKFTPKGGRIAVRLDVEGGDAALSVSDTGVGIAPADLPTLFQAFRQVDADPARSKGGLGLGLAVVKGLVELHGGRVEAASAGAGRGATFTIRLPLDAGEPAVAPAMAPGAVSTGVGWRVVIVEDNTDAAESLRELLELKGFAVSVAASGPDGLELCRSKRPDAVVCDIGLPGMTGFDVARALRADPATAGAVLVAVSGYAQDEDRRKATEAGFDALIPKPADIEVLARTLSKPRT